MATQRIMEQVASTKHGGQPSPIDSTELCLLSFDGDVMSRQYAQNTSELETNSCTSKIATAWGSEDDKLITEFIEVVFQAMNRLKLHDKGKGHQRDNAILV